MSSTEEPLPGEARNFPRWLREIDGSLAVNSQFILTGNIRDSYLLPGEEGSLGNLFDALWEMLKPSGYECIIGFDVVDGLYVWPNDGAESSAAKAAESILGGAKLGQRYTLEKLPQIMRDVISNTSIRAAFVIDYADRLINDAAHLTDIEREFFASCQKMSNAHSKTAAPAGIQRTMALFNPIFWVTRSERSLPSWLYTDSNSVRVVPVPLPDLTERITFASKSIVNLPGYESLPDSDREEAWGSLAESTEGISAAGLLNIIVLAQDQKVAVGDIDDAARTYRVGVNENPWKKTALRERILNGENTIENRVRGQGDAVRKSLDILVRSATGLTGAQASAHSTRPRGVLFLAGPTGVGKTEMAKALTELIFGDEDAYIRLDMSEYSAEHAEARLVGAPPGYVGHDAGGQLTDAVRRRPFSLVLFDEIEKAHPRILDKFLQVLDDGRLTDGAGITAHFSETILVFTSNLGISEEDESTGVRVPVVTRDDPRDEFESKIRAAITKHFVSKLQRPELLNRFGDNIVVFDFIDPKVGEQIFDIQIKNVADRIKQEQGCTLEILPEVRAQLLAAALENLDMGGRGIGSVIETALVNPLAREIFAESPANGTTVKVVSCERSDRNWDLTLEIV